MTKISNFKENQLNLDIDLDECFANEQLKLVDDLLTTFRKMRLAEFKGDKKLKARFDYLSLLIDENRVLYEREKARTQT